MCDDSDFIGTDWRVTAWKQLLRWYDGDRPQMTQSGVRQAKLAKDRRCKFSTE